MLFFLISFSSYLLVVYRNIVDFYVLILHLMSLLSSLSILTFFFLLHWVFVAVHRLYLVAATGATLFAVCGLLIVVASLVVEHGLSIWVHRLSCPTACGIFPQTCVPSTGR